MTSSIGFNEILTNIDTTLKQCRDKLYQRCFNVVPTLDSNAVTKLCNVENTMSNFVSFSTLDQLYFKLIHNVETTLIQR